MHGKIDAAPLEKATRANGKPGTEYHGPDLTPRAYTSSALKKLNRAKKYRIPSITYRHEPPEPDLCFSCISGSRKTKKNAARWNRIDPRHGGGSALCALRYNSYIWPDILFPAGPDLLFQIGAGITLNKYNETMRMVSQSSILKPPESLHVPICTHIRQTQSLSPHEVRWDFFSAENVLKEL